MSEWTLYGQTLNLERFLRLHPGGDVALLLGADRDCTRLFEQYHIRGEGHKGKLQAFVDLQTSTPRQTPINFPDEDPFQRDVLAEVNKLDGTKTTWSMLGLIILFGMGTGWAWWGWINGNWLACLVLPFIKWLFIVNSFHDAAHFAFSSSPLVNELVAHSPSPLYLNTAYWYLQHNCSHHTNTNQVGHDIDLYHGFPWVRFHWAERWTPVHRFQVGTVFLMNFLWATFAETIIYPTMMILRVGPPRHFLGSYGRLLQRMRFGLCAQLGLCFGYLVYPWLAFGVGWKAATFVFYPYFMASMIFMTITQISHIQAVTQPGDGDKGSWMRQMVESSLDYNQGSAFWSVVTGGLNMQSLHHCLPVLSSSRYRAFYPRFREICLRHGLIIREVPSFWDAVRNYWSYVKQLSWPKIE
jgi:fatty acid desaturase